MKDSIGVAVVGAGMAGRSHAYGYRLAESVAVERMRRVRLVAIADTNGAFAADAAQRYGFERHETSWRSIADDPTVDAVSIVVANDLHREIAVGLLEAGKHVLCDKPMANSLADAQAMVAAADRSGRIAVLGYSYRRSPSVNAIRDEIARGSMGRMRHLDLHYWCDYGADANAAMTWRYRGGPGTGALADLGTHLVDLAEFLAGSARSVSAGATKTFITERPVATSVVRGHAKAEVGSETATVENEDVVSFSASFESGATGVFSISRVALGHPNSLGFSVFGDAAAASFDQATPAEFQFFDATVPERTRGFRRVLAGPVHPYLEHGLPMTHSGVGYGYAELFAFQARAFLDQVAGVAGLPPCPSFGDGLHSMLVMDAVVRSARDGGATAVVG